MREQARQFPPAADQSKHALEAVDSSRKRLFLQNQLSIRKLPLAAVWNRQGSFPQNQLPIFFVPASDSG